MIEFGEFTTKFKRLQDFFGKQLKSEQLTICYDKLRYFDYDIVSEAIESLIESDQKAFPSLGVILGYCREARYRKVKGAGIEYTEKGCSRCSNGYVVFTRNGYQYYGDCAICNKGKSSVRQTYLMQVDDRILPAYFLSGKLFNASPTHLKDSIPGAIPELTNHRLDEIFRSRTQKDMVA